MVTRVQINLGIRCIPFFFFWYWYVYRNSLTWNLNSKRAFVVGGYHKILVNQTSDRNKII